LSGVAVDVWRLISAGGGCEAVTVTVTRRFVCLQGARTNLIGILIGLLYACVSHISSDVPALFIAALWNRAGHYIFALWFSGDDQTSCKVWLTSVERRRCSNEAKTRNPLKFARVPQTRQPISAVNGPKFTILWGHVEEILLFNRF